MLCGCVHLCRFSVSCVGLVFMCRLGSSRLSGHGVGLVSCVGLVFMLG